MTRSAELSGNGSAIADAMTSVVPESKISMFTTRSPSEIYPAPTLRMVASGPANSTSALTRLTERGVTRNGSGGLAKRARRFLGIRAIHVLLDRIYKMFQTLQDESC